MKIICQKDLLVEAVSNVPALSAQNHRFRLWRESCSKQKRAHLS